jgi:hypothetical protein
MRSQEQRIQLVDRADANIPDSWRRYDHAGALGVSGRRRGTHLHVLCPLAWIGLPE